VQLDTGTATPMLTPRQLSPVEVDLGGLDDFRTLVSRELDGNLRPATHGITADHRRGVGFGDQNVGSAIQAARARYSETLATATANMTAYVESAEVLIEAIRRVSRNYRDVDLSSAAGSMAVNSELTAAMIAARQAELDALVAARQRAWEIRTRHQTQDGAGA
jgi:hypothetical protein